MQIQVLNTLGFLGRIRNSDKFVIGWDECPSFTTHELFNSV